MTWDSRIRWTIYLGLCIWVGGIYIWDIPLPEVVTGTVFVMYGHLFGMWQEKTFRKYNETETREKS